ncbi:hypothetical protein [Rhizorhabdus histidinilytica]|uniref:hypothetical protein n=1 Tax=Rhizorhabdus histidinilytica TaxID=439228 RepID=UPI0032205420
MTSGTRRNRLHDESLGSNHRIVANIQIPDNFCADPDENPVSDPWSRALPASTTDIRSYCNLVQNQTIVSNRRQTGDEYSLQAVLEPYPLTKLHRKWN